MSNFAFGCKNRTFVLYLKKLIAKKSLKNGFQRPSRPFSFDKVQSVGLLVSYDLASERPQWERLLRSCIPERATISQAIFSEKPIKNSGLEMVFSPKNMTVDGLFDTDELNAFFNKDVDVFMVCSNVDSPFLNIILRKVNAGLTISNLVSTRRCADFVVEVEPFEPNIFFTETAKYLKLIKK